MTSDSFSDGPITLHTPGGKDVSINRHSVDAVYKAASSIAAPRDGNTAVVAGGQTHYVKESADEVAKGVGGLRDFTFVTGDKLFVRPSEIQRLYESGARA